MDSNRLNSQATQELLDRMAELPEGNSMPGDNLVDEVQASHSHDSLTMNAVLQKRWREMLGGMGSKKGTKQLTVAQQNERKAKARLAGKRRKAARKVMRSNRK